MLRKQISVDSLEIDISAERADQAVEDVALGDICNEDRDVISFHLAPNVGPEPGRSG